MSTMLWVAAPLAALLAYLLVRKLAGRALSRHRTNVVLSLVLLVYFGATAGLGIFWVARQQLPVFELHYVFGYVALLLVAVHVTLNFGIVKRTLLGPSRRGKRPSAPGVPRWLAYGAAIAVLALGVFYLGTRYGGRWAPAAPAASPGEASASLAMVRHYHEVSSESRASAFARAPLMSWEKPPPFKRYPDQRPRVELPPPSPPERGRPLDAALDAPPRRDRAGDSLDLRSLSAILHQSAGITLQRGGLALRATPSSGALFPSEIYVAAREVEGLAPGLYHFDCENHQLVQLRDTVPTAVELGHPAHPSLGRAPAILVATAIFARTGHKYGHRAYRYVLADLGHLLENLRLAASEAGFAATTLRAFDEARVAETLSLDTDEEGALAVVPLARDTSFDTLEADPLAPASVPSSHPLGPTGRMHAATSLRVEDAATERDGEPIALPDASPAETDVWEAIVNRRSVRTYDEQPLSLGSLAALLSATRGPGPLLSRHVTTWVVAHRVEGLAAGAYRYDDSSHALHRVRAGDLRAETQSAMLSQRMAGDAAAVLMLTVDGEAVFASGARAYRHAWLEVGMRGERVYLSASAQGLGACAAGAFFDDESAALLNLEGDRWVAHFVSVGRRR